MVLELKLNFINAISNEIIKEQLRDTTIPMPREKELVRLDDDEYEVFRVEHDFTKNQVVINIYLKLNVRAK